MSDSVPLFPPLAVRPREAARLIGVSRAHFTKLLKAKKIPSRRDGSARLILREDLIAYVKGLPGAEPEDDPPPEPSASDRAIKHARATAPA